ncbi:hypothetical protein AcV7_003623 [Taiwanofungus camphoratus]|nr:hypothetical protein AcV7_003623 [Antrodia cinnamomea]
MFSERKASYKTPPATVRDSLTSQERRRQKALEEQKRRRAERFDSTRQLDFFADLSLGASDDEADVDDGVQDGPEVVREGIAQFATMLPPSASGSSPSAAIADAATSESAVPTSQASDMQTNGKKRGKTKRKGKARNDHAASTSATGKHGAKKSKPNKWADKCMYAELLEMTDEFDYAIHGHDGIPEDIEAGWVAVTPVPAGKRCLAVTHQASGIAGVAPNVTLRSRVLGKPLMKSFPSPLPPQTVLDCILDENWRDNGILHVLDVLQWKGQDVTECETAFRFWWRDTRLSELPAFPPPPNASEPPAKSSGSVTQSAASSSAQYQFPYPATFVPIPYHTNTTLAHLASTLIPLTRSSRLVAVSVPISPSITDNTREMELDGALSPLVQLQSVSAEIRSDGLLLHLPQIRRRAVSQRRP